MGFYLVMPPVMDAKRGIAFLWALPGLLFGSLGAA